MFIILLPFLPWPFVLPTMQLSYVSLRFVRVCLKRDRCVDLHILLAFVLVFRIFLDCYCRSTNSFIHIFLLFWSKLFYFTPKTILDFYSCSACSLRSSKLDKLLSLNSCLCWGWVWVNDWELMLFGWLYCKWGPYSFLVMSFILFLLLFLSKYILLISILFTMFYRTGSYFIFSSLFIEQLYRSLW